ncbi:MAG: HAMP domain-containing sensor histidine kinase [Steroidobacteraceae bacterium]
MKRLRPRSLSALALIGLAIIALPLIAALALAGLQMRQVSERSARIVADGVAATRLTQELFSQSALLERQIRLYQVLDSPQLLETYAAQDRKLRDIEQRLTTQLPAGEARRSLQQLSAQREQITAQMLGTPGVKRDFDRMLSDFARMQTMAAEVAELSNAHIESETVSLRARTERTQQVMFWGLVLLIPLTAAAILLLSLRVGRPLRQVDRAISELGSGALHSPIHVRGPADIEKLGRQLEWLRLRLLDLAQERNRFLRHMSHELKTPLANIREGTELLMDGAVGELQSGQREVTGILRENGLKLQRMIENLLSFSAWQTSSVGLELSDFRLRPLVKQIIENQQLALLAQRVRLDVSIEDLSMAGDRGKMRLILENLLSNAIKYTPRSGTIHIRARAVEGDLVLEVADSGPGIAAEERKQVFEAFYTGKAPAGHIKGTGIGLSVVMEFVNAHGGRIEIIDGEWPGAHFRIRMPLKTARTGKIEARAAHAA